MKKNVAGILLIISIFQTVYAQRINHYVNPFIGTTAEGNTVPGATMPFGMVQLSPDTRVDIPSGYDYKDSIILGFSHTHLSGTGIGDLGDILTQPIRISGLIINDTFPNFSSSFSHQQENAKPGYYQVYLSKPKVKVELTATERCGMQKYTYQNNHDTSAIFIDLKHSIFSSRENWMPDDVYDCYLKIENKNTLIGYKKSKGWAPQQQVYFVMNFSKNFKSSYISNTHKVYHQINYLEDSLIQAIFTFENTNQPLVVKTGISATSISAAQKNLESEMPDFNFDKYKKQAAQKWHEALSRIAIKASAKQKKIFYTALYHTMVTPNLVSDIGGSFFGPDFKNHTSKKANYYSTFSLWDTYRAVHPLYSIICPSKNAEFVNSMLQHYTLFGRLPLWTLWGTENYCMTGNPAIPIIADAILKNTPNINTELAWEAVYQSATKNFPRYDFDIKENYGYIPNNFGLYGSKGDNNRYDLIDKLGYIPNDLVRGSATILLELCYDDWCVAQLANTLNKPQKDFFLHRAGAYKNIFDKKVGFIRPRLANGNWENPFDPYSFTDWKTSAFVEGNAFQYSFYVPHQVDTLIQLFGGKKHFELMIDALFSKKTNVKNFGAISGLIGQYAHGNEPSHHIAYLYNFVGKNEKTAQKVSEIIRTQYENAPNGLAGNDDCGQMSAWYVFSSLGFYPVNPADGKYYFGTSTLRKAYINLESKKQLAIKYHHKNKESIYINRILLNGKPVDINFITQKAIEAGGKLDIYLSNKPIR